MQHVGASAQLHCLNINLAAVPPPSTRGERFVGCIVDTKAAVE